MTQPRSTLTYGAVYLSSPSRLASAQVIDARNPLLFRCPDVETYTHEHAGKKENLLILNKADFLTAEMRVLWRRYFRKLGVMVRGRAGEGQRGRAGEREREREREYAREREREEN